MFTNRLFNLFVALALVAVIALTAQTAFSQMNSTYRESPEQVQREFELGEHYGQTPPNALQFSAQEILREYILGERYGVTSQGYAEQQALQAYQLGERYGQTPKALLNPARSANPIDPSYDAVEQIRSKRHSIANVALDRSYDHVEQLRLGRVANVVLVDRSYDWIESLRASRTN